jgi:D-alanine transaminase
LSRLPLANWNGVEMPLSEVRVPALDRAFLFGDAVYEGLRIYGGRVFLCAEHVQRLRRSLGELRIAADVERLERRMLETVSHSGVREGFIYIQVTRGTAPRRTHRFPDPPTTPNELIWVDEITSDAFAALRETGARLLTFRDVRWQRCDIKSVNLLGNCLAAQAAAEAGCSEALLVDRDGTITEGSHTSVFGVRGGRIITSPLGPHILPGITRALVLGLAERARIPVAEESMRRDRLREIDELFLTGTTAEVLPITVVDNEPIGDGRPGPVARRLFATYHEFVQDWLSGSGS